MKKKDFKLSKEDINTILQNSKDSICDEFYMLKFDCLSIKYKCSISGLILPHGNEYFGYEHIRLRHQNVSSKYWKGDKRNPNNIFSRDIFPYMYGNIASQIYLNHSSEILQENDLTEYIGEYNGKEYFLIIEKDSKIIITMYPKDINEKNNYYRDRFKEYNTGGSNSSYSSSGFINYELSIINSNHDIVYKLIIEYSYASPKVENWFLKNMKTQEIKKIIKDEDIKLNYNFPILISTSTENDRSKIFKLIKRNI